MPRSLRAFLALTLPERALAARAWGLFWLLEPATGRIALRRLEGWLAALARRTPHRSAVEPERLAWLVAAAARHHPLRPRCLARALMLAHLLHRRGVETRLRIGVRRREDGLDAHAWLELDGRALGEPTDLADRFARLVADHSEGPGR